MAWTAPKVDWASADGVAYGDLNEIGANLVYLKDNHADLTTGVHGGVAIATPSTFMTRDAAGRAAVVAPSAETDIALKSNVTAEALARVTADGLQDVTIAALDTDKMPIAGGTFTGKAYAQANTDYTTGQIRNVFFSTAAPVAEGGNGDLWVRYEA